MMLVPTNRAWTKLRADAGLTLSRVHSSTDLAQGMLAAFEFDRLMARALEWRSAEEEPDDDDARWNALAVHKSVTPRRNCNDGTLPTVIRLTPTMVDTLQITMRGGFSAEFNRRVLKWLKKNASPRAVTLSGIGSMKLGYRFARGERYGRSLSSPEVHIEWAKDGGSRITFHPPLLWADGVEAAVQRVLCAWSECAYGRPWEWGACGTLAERITRLDICRHFQGLNFELGDLNAFVGRASKRLWDSGDRTNVRARTTGPDFSFGGTRSAIQARIYNKSRQLRQRRKSGAHYRESWARYSSSRGDVTTVEFQHRGERGLVTFADYDFSDLTILLETEALEALWAHDTRNTLSLRQPNGDKTRSRWPIDQRWTTIMSTTVVPAKRDPTIIRQRWKEDQMTTDDDALMNALARVAAHHEMPDWVVDDESARKWALAIADQRTVRTISKATKLGFLSRLTEYQQKYQRFCR